MSSQYIESKQNASYTDKYSNTDSSSSYVGGDGPVDGGGILVASFDSVIDLYNPLKPNDYLQLCVERIEKKRLFELQEENNRRLEELERGRFVRETERKQANDEGDLTKVRMLMLATQTGPGRGRGRGLSNLPAWMTAAASVVDGGGDGDGGTEGDSLELGDAKRSRTTQLPSFEDRNYDEDGSNKNSSSSSISGSSVGASGAGVGASGARRRSALNTPSCILLLSNMVAIGEVDE